MNIVQAFQEILEIIETHTDEELKAAEKLGKKNEIHINYYCNLKLISCS